MVVVDEGSSDDTGEQAREAGATVVTHLINRGQGAALKTGLDSHASTGAVQRRARLLTLRDDAQAHVVRVHDSVRVAEHGRYAFFDFRQEVGVL